jgi:hypothetical protein
MVDAYSASSSARRSVTRSRSSGHAYILPLGRRPVVEVVPAGGNALRVQVAAPVAVDVAAGPALFEALNEVNARLPYGRVFLAGDRVWVEDTVLGESVSPLLDNAIHFVSWAVTGRTVPDLAEAGGGPAPADRRRTDHGRTPAGGTAPARPCEHRGRGRGSAPCLPGTAAGDAHRWPDPCAVNAAGYL